MDKQKLAELILGGVLYRAGMRDIVLVAERGYYGNEFDALKKRLPIEFEGVEFHLSYEDNNIKLRIENATESQLDDMIRIYG